MSNKNEMPDFLQDLAKGAENKGGSRDDSLDIKVVNMRNFKNHGTVMMSLFDGKDGSKGITQLNRVAVVEKWVSGVTKEGKEYGFAEKKYFFMDPRPYGDLTPEQTLRHERIKSKISSVPKNKGIAMADILLLQGWTLSHRDVDNKLISEKEASLYIFHSKNFIKSLNNAIKAQTDMTGSYNWLAEFTSRELVRKRFLNFNTYLSKEQGAGYIATVTLGKFDSDTARLTDGKDHLDLTGNEEVLEKFGNPVKKLCGLAEDDDLFNEEYLNDLEASTNIIISGGTPTEAAKEPQTPNAPNSNENYRRDEDPLPMGIGSDEESDDDDDMRISGSLGSGEDNPF